MNKFICVVLLCFVIGEVVLDTVVYSDCGSEYNLDDVDIEGCNKLGCILPKGRSARIHIKLYGRDPDSRLLTQTVYLLFNGIHVPVPVTPDDLCSQVICPVKASANASFSSTMNFATLPNVQSAVTLYWQIHNEKGDLIMCFKSKARYENPKRLWFYLNN